jgi:glycine/D-amino acid oxidase-like deaminating enzyme
MKDFDVIVVGAGIVGVSTAYHILESDPKKKVLLLEKLSGAGLGDTQKSTQDFRNYYSNNIDFVMGDSSADFYLHLQNDENVNLHLMKNGYLWLVNEGQYKTNRGKYENMTSMGVDLKVYEEEELSSLLDMNTSVSADDESKMMGLLDVNKGILAIKAGHLSTDLLVDYYLRSFLALGGNVRFNVHVKNLQLEPKVKIGVPFEPFLWQDVEINGVVTANGVLTADEVVLCSGVWVEKFLDPLGIESHQKVVKRAHFFVKASTDPLRGLLNAKGFNPGEAVPNIILPRPQIMINPDIYQRNFWVLYPHHSGVPFGAEEVPEINENYYSYGLYPIVVKYFPQFKNVRPDYSQAGYRVIMDGSVESRLIRGNGLLVITATHGIIQGDALGRLAAAALEGKEIASLYNGKSVKVNDFIFQSHWNYSLSPDHHV